MEAVWDAPVMRQGAVVLEGSHLVLAVNRPRRGTSDPTRRTAMLRREAASFQSDARHLREAQHLRSEPKNALDQDAFEKPMKPPGEPATCPFCENR